MTNRPEVPGIRTFDSGAVDWGALRAIAEAVRLQMECVEALILLFRTDQPTGFDCPGAHGLTRDIDRGASSARTAQRTLPGGRRTSA